HPAGWAGAMPPLRRPRTQTRRGEKESAFLARVFAETGRPAVELRRSPETFLQLGAGPAHDTISEFATRKGIGHGTQEGISVRDVEHGGGTHHGGKLAIGKRNRRHDGMRESKTPRIYAAFRLVRNINAGEFLPMLDPAGIGPCETDMAQA